MKVINYKRSMGSLFDCSIHGRIIITWNEFLLIKDLLRSMPIDSSYPWIKRLALEDIQTGISRSATNLAGNGNPMFNIRVTATEYIVNILPHTGTLKRGNYYFEIIDKKPIHYNTTCPKYKETVLPDDQGNCSLCGAQLL